MTQPTPNMITPDNCPRDYEGLKNLSRVVRYRLALGLAIFQSEAQDHAYAAAPDDDQVRALMTALSNRDNGMHPTNGQAQQPMQQQPQYAPAAVPPPNMGMPAPVTPQPLAVTPAPAAAYGPPPQMGVPPGYQQQPQQQHMAPPPPPMQQPQYQQQPMPPQYAPPPPAPMPGMPPAPQAAPPPYAPAPSYPPQQPQYAPAPPMAAPPPPPAPPSYQPQQQQPQYAPPPPQMQQAPQPQMARQPSTFGDPANSGGRPAPAGDLAKLAAIEQTVLGIARTQNMMFNLVLEIAQNQLGLDKQTIAGLLIKHAQEGEPNKFFDVSALQGKAQ